MLIGALIALALALTDAQLAERAVLKPTDLPRGWTAVEQAQAVSCPALDAARDAASGTARSKTFKRGERAEAGAAVHLFRDTAAAKRRFRAMSGSGTLRCYAERLHRVLSERAAVGESGRERLALARVGDQRAAARFTVAYNVGGIDARLFVDLVFVRAGRGVSLGAFLGVQRPFDAGLRTRLTAKQVRRLPVDD